MAAIALVSVLVARGIDDLAETLFSTKTKKRLELYCFPALFSNRPSILSRLPSLGGFLVLALSERGGKSCDNNCADVSRFAKAHPKTSIDLR